MKFKVKATRDIQQAYGDRTFDLKAGETTEISAQGFEVVMRDSFGGGFQLVEEIPETDMEKQRAEKQKEAERLTFQSALKKKLTSLMKLSKEELTDKARDLEIEGYSELNKEPLAKAIAEKEVGGKK